MEFFVLNIILRSKIKKKNGHEDIGLIFTSYAVFSPPRKYTLNLLKTN